MLLAIDVGNTDTKLGFFARGENGMVGELQHTWRVTTSRRRTSDEYGVLFRALFSEAGVALDAIDAIAVSSVVPPIESHLRDACLRYFERTPLFINAATQRLIEVRTERPVELGSDLLCGAIGAVARYGAPAIVIGYGTATTFSAISRDGAFLGTALAPGIQISIDALISRAAKLPQIALETPLTAIGRETVASLQSGFVFGFVGQTEGIVTRIKAEIGEDARTIATGGLANVVGRQTAMIDEIDPHLILEGLRLFYEASR